MDLTSLSQAVTVAFLPHISSLLQIGTAAGEGIAQGAMKSIGADVWGRMKEMWSRLELESGGGKQAAAAVAEQPDDQLAISSLVFHVRQMLKENPGLMRDAEQFVQSGGGSTTVVASGTGSISVGGNVTHSVIVGNTTGDSK